MRKQKQNLTICLLLILVVGFGCTNFQRPWRDYSEKPFNSEEWLAGDAIERGRMVTDAFKRRIPDRKSKEEIVKLFGKPDKKVTVEGREVWLYRAENKLHNRLNQLPISFDSKKGAFIGGVKGGTMSMVVDEEWAN